MVWLYIFFILLLSGAWIYTGNWLGTAPALGVILIVGCVDLIKYKKTL